MMFRRKLLAVFALTVFLSVAAVAWLVSEVTRRAFGHDDDERTAGGGYCHVGGGESHGDGVEPDAGGFGSFF